MLKHYIRVAIRNLARHRVLTLINVSGLSLGLACFSLILLFAVNEFSYDRWQEKAARIYRVDQTWTRENGTEDAMAGLNMPLGPAMKKDFPDVEQYVRWSPSGEEIMKVDNRINRIGLSFADASMFSVFSFPLLAGTAADALQDPHSLVLTRSKAIQLFGGWDVVGRIVQVKIDTAFQPFTVTAIAEDLPSNSSVKFEALGNYEWLKTRPNRQGALDCWNCTNGDNTYVLLRPDSRLMDEPRRLLDFRLRYYPDEAQIYQKTRVASSKFLLRPLLKAHTTPNVDGIASVDPKNIWILLAIAGSILLIASINFTTLAIARSASRAKEVGVRKVIGSGRGLLVLQFLTESVLLSIISAILGCLLAYTLLPWFNQLADRHLEFSLVRFPELSWMIAGLTLLVGLLAGSYPALVLSGFNPVEVLKTKIRLGGSNLFTRGLVTVQFVLSIGLIIATVIMLQQVGYMRSRDLGLIKENTFVVNANDANKEIYYRRFREAMASRRDVKGITASVMGLGEGKGEMGYGFDINGKKTGVIIYPVDQHFIPVMGMRLVAGRNFNPALTSDTVSAMIVNETMVRDALGVTPEQAIGMQCVSKGRNPMQKTIIGVVRDFNFEPLNRKVRAQAFWMPASFVPSAYFVQLTGGDPREAIAAAEKVWKQTVPDAPFLYSFLDEDLDRFYKSEARWGSIVASAGVISIFLACLGLFGLAALAAANRIKEIGIRKVLGASTMEIVRLLTGGFLRLVVLATLIASPMAWLVMNRWLRDFAYRINIGWTVFAITTIAATGIAFVTIAVLAVRTAKGNPVDSLRAE